MQKTDGFLRCRGGSQIWPLVHYSDIPFVHETNNEIFQGAFLSKRATQTAYHLPKELLLSVELHPTVSNMTSPIPSFFDRPMDLEALLKGNDISSSVSALP